MKKFTKEMVDKYAKDLLILLTEEENQLIELEKENKQLRMENDILKQAALIMGRK